MSIWVVNTSPLMFLGNLGRLELLRHERREIYVPRAVAEEVAEKPAAAAQAVQASCATWMQVRSVRHMVSGTAQSSSRSEPTPFGRYGDDLRSASCSRRATDRNAWGSSQGPR
jgi:hypothetical protein